MLYVVMIFLWASILLYLLLGGADFGAGILEFFTRNKNRKKTREKLYKAIGPVWEANHMWLIIMIVILFVGFPVIYTTVATYLHIPLVIMLFGIIARGTAFTFLHYDAVKDNMQKVYEKVFIYSTFITPLFLGIIAASVVSGTIDPSANNFVDAYIFSWLHFFSVTVGIFTVTICGYLAAIFIIGETDNEQDSKRFIRKAKQMIAMVACCGILVFIAAWFENIALTDWLFGNAIGIICISSALISLLLLWYFLKKEKKTVIRFLAGFQVAMILIAITWSHYPDIIVLKGGKYLSLLDDAGHEKTIYALGIALLLGSVFILPFLAYLLYSFHNKKSVE
ncbi:MAG: cytochrome d ubiquinol oxidase subunit II [Ferruginibacter sp.]